MRGNSKCQDAAAAAAKSLQLCLTLRDPIDSSPSGSPVPGILQARTLEWVAISFSNASKCKVKEESEKVGLKLNIQKTKIIASGPITSWQIDGEKLGTVADFIFLGSKITADGDCSHEIKIHLLLGRKLYQPRHHIRKQRHYLANKSLSSQVYAFSSSHVWMWELDS